MKTIIEKLAHEIHLCDNVKFYDVYHEPDGLIVLRLWGELGEQNAMRLLNNIGISEEYLNELKEEEYFEFYEYDEDTEVSTVCVPVND